MRKLREHLHSVWLRARRRAPTKGRTDVRHQSQLSAVVDRPESSTAAVETSPDTEDEETFFREVEASLDDMVDTGKRLMLTSLILGVAAVALLKAIEADLTSLGYRPSADGPPQKVGLGLHAILAAIVLPLFVATQLQGSYDSGTVLGQVRAFVLDGVTSGVATTASLWSATAMCWNLWTHRETDMVALGGWFFYAFLGTLCRRQGGSVEKVRRQLSLERQQKEANEIRMRLGTSDGRLISEQEVRERDQGGGRRQGVRRRARAAMPWVGWAVVHWLALVLALVVQRAQDPERPWREGPWAAVALVALFQVVLAGWGAIVVIEMRSDRISKRVIDQVMNGVLSILPALLEAILILSVAIALIRQGLDWSGVALGAVFLASATLVILLQFVFLPRSKAGQAYLHNRLVRRSVSDIDALAS